MIQNIEKLNLYTCVEAIKVLLNANTLIDSEQIKENIEELLNSSEIKKIFNLINEDIDVFKKRIFEYINLEQTKENKKQINQLVEKILLKVEK